MRNRRLRSSIATAATVVSLLSTGLSPTGAASAAEYEVKMLNKGPDHAMQFDPELLRISPGDTVHFVAADKGHSVETISGMIPDGAEPFSGDFNQDVTVTLTKEGVYGFQCRPHGSMGMVGLIVVGRPTNEDSAKGASLPGMAKETFLKLFRNLDNHLAARN